MLMPLFFALMASASQPPCQRAFRVRRFSRCCRHACQRFSPRCHYFDYRCRDMLAADAAMS